MRNFAPDAVAQHRTRGIFCEVIYLAVERYFGLPGCGKTTTLAMRAVKAIHSGRYKNVYSNVYLSVHGVTVIPFEFFFAEIFVVTVTTNDHSFINKE